MKNQSSSRAVLGIYVSPTSIEGVLVEAADGPVRILHRMVRQRKRKGEVVGSDDLGNVVPGLKSSEESDFTIEIGDGSNASTAPDPMLAAEIGGSGSSSNGDGSAGGGHTNGLPFDAQLKEMLAECGGIGYPEPEIAFCATPPDVSFVELTVPGSSDNADGAEVPRKKLLEHLEKAHRSGFDRQRVAFYPMTPEDGQARYLAVVPSSHDTITRSLESIQKRKQSFEATPRMVETETTLLANLLQQQTGVEDANTAIVRVGSEDTLILFFEGTSLRHYERLRSLTSYDVPETICSRVMLQQDEQKIGSLETVYVLGSHEDRLLDAFQNFYPDAAVLPLQEAFPLEQWDPEVANEPLSPTRLPALAAALRLLYPESGRAPTNLLGSTPRRRLRLLPFAWHSGIALVLLLGAVLFFGWQYLNGQAEIERQRELMEQDPVQMPSVEPEALQARVDSLQAVYQQHTRALQVLDSLLMGSDLWSRTLERTSLSTGGIGQIWFTSWRPSGNNTIRIEGQALTRGNVAVLARRLNGVIERLEYSEENDVRLYPFTIQAPLNYEMPRVALYLQEVAAGTEPEDVRDDAAPLLRSAGLQHD